MSWFTVLRLLLYRSVLELFSKSFKVFHCSVINVRCCYFQQLVYSIISSSRCQQLFYFFFVVSQTRQLWYLIMFVIVCQHLFSFFLFLLFNTLIIISKRRYPANESLNDICKIPSFYCCNNFCVSICICCLIICSYGFVSTIVCITSLPPTIWAYSDSIPTCGINEIKNTTTIMIKEPLINPSAAP